MSQRDVTVVKSKSIRGIMVNCTMYMVSCICLSPPPHHHHTTTQHPLSYNRLKSLSARSINTLSTKSVSCLAFMREFFFFQLSTEGRDDDAYSRGNVRSPVLMTQWQRTMIGLFSTNKSVWLQWERDYPGIPSRLDLIHNIFRVEKEKEIISSFQSWKLKSMETSRLFFFYLKIV